MVQKSKYSKIKKKFITKKNNYYFLYSKKFSKCLTYLLY